MSPLDDVETLVMDQTPLWDNLATFVDGVRLVRRDRVEQ